MSIQLELKTVLKRLKLSAMLATLPDRVAYARKEKLDYAQFLELVLFDEVERRDHKHVTNRLTAAGFEEEWHTRTLRLVRQNPPRPGAPVRPLRPSLHRTEGERDLLRSCRC